MVEDLDILEQNELSLLETLDHVLTRGLVIAGEITISVADVDLIFVGLNVVLTSVETAREIIGEREERARGLNKLALPSGARKEESE